MRNRKIYKQLQRILQTSVSPKHNEIKHNGRVFYNPSISMSSYSTESQSNRTDGWEHYQQKSSKIALQSKNVERERIAVEIEKRRAKLQNPLTVWQLRTNNSIYQKNLQIAALRSQDQKFSYYFVKLCKICLRFSSKFPSNRSVLQVLMLSAKGHKREAMFLAIKWLLAWIRNIFRAFSSALGQKFQQAI